MELNILWRRQKVNRHIDKIVLLDNSILASHAFLYLTSQGTESLCSELPFQDCTGNSFG